MENVKFRCFPNQKVRKKPLYPYTFDALKSDAEIWVNLGIGEIIDPLLLFLNAMESVEEVDNEETVADNNEINNNLFLDTLDIVEKEDEKVEPEQVADLIEEDSIIKVEPESVADLIEDKEEKKTVKNLFSKKSTKKKGGK